jgi:arylsulfatase A-like enzyme/Flp pilus assembly protein TadD
MIVRTLSHYMVTLTVTLTVLGVGVGWLILRTTNGLPALSQGAMKGHNVLLITIDTLRADRLGCYGSTKGLTPNLDRLAAEGIRFDDVLAHVPMTLPAHASIFTSMYPTKHGVHDNGTFRLDTKLPTLTTVLKEAGYHTGAFIGAFVLDARFGLNHGFDVYDDYLGEKRVFLSFIEVERRAEAVIAPAERWIREEAREPWFGWVHLFDPHAPYAAPPAFQSAYPNDRYGAEIAYVDDVIGSFIDRLLSSGDLNRTLVVVVGDHGESLGDHGERTHGTFAYNTTLRVPWILWSQEGIPAQVFTGIVRHVDIMPTVLDLLGVKQPDNVDGRSLRPYLNGEKRYVPPVSYFEALNVHLTRDWAPLRGIVDDGYKLIDLPIPELYDLERDREEKSNIYEKTPERVRQLEDEFQAITDQAGVVETSVPDLETVTRLQTLGYVTMPVTRRKSQYTEDDDPKRLIDLSNAYDDSSVLFAQGRRKEALAILEDLVRKQPRSSQAHQKLAFALRQVGRLEEAIEVLRSAVGNGVQEKSLVALLGVYLIEAGREGEAASLLEELVHRDPDYAEGHTYLGFAYGRLGRLEEARREFEIVLELDPSSAQTYNSLGSMALDRGDLAEALRLLKEALKYDPELAGAHNALGVAYARTGDRPRSIESWRRAVELAPRQYDALYNLAVALAESSPREAVPYLERFAREAPKERYRDDIEQVRVLLRRIGNQPQSR